MLLEIWRKNLIAICLGKMQELFSYLLIIHWIIHITFVNILRRQKFGPLHAQSSSFSGELRIPSSLAGSKYFSSDFCPFGYLYLGFFTWQSFCQLLQVFDIRIFVVSFSLIILLWNPKNRVKICIFFILCCKNARCPRVYLYFNYLSDYPPLLSPF